jgi:hypothetical protein
MDAVPEFNSLWPDNLPTMVFGHFGIFLRDRISQYGLTDRVVRDSLGILNSALSISNDADFQNLVQVGVFEPLCDRQETVSAALTLLTGKARSLFVTTLSWFPPSLKE